MEESRCYRYTLDVQRMRRDAIVVHEMFNGGFKMLSCSMEESRCYRYTLDVQRMSRDAIVVHEMFSGGVEMLSSRDAIVIHLMFNGGVEILPLYMRCSTDELRFYRSLFPFLLAGGKNQRREDLALRWEAKALEF
ncbi:hypothetical protein Tco_0122110 [Tanacetum coccineum]